MHMQGCSWVIVTKYLADGTEEPKMGHVVLQGFGQGTGFDYF